jgi:hypothetical protein
VRFESNFFGKTLLNSTTLAAVVNLAVVGSAPGFLSNPFQALYLKEVKYLIFKWAKK